MNQKRSFNLTWNQWASIEIHWGMKHHKQKQIKSKIHRSEPGPFNTRWDQIWISEINASTSHQSIHFWIYIKLLKWSFIIFIYFLFFVFSWFITLKSSQTRRPESWKASIEQFWFQTNNWTCTLWTDEEPDLTESDRVDWAVGLPHNHSFTGEWQQIWNKCAKQNVSFSFITVISTFYVFTIISSSFCGWTINYLSFYIYIYIL